MPPRAVWVRSIVVVADPGGQRLQALVVGPVEPPIGPLGEQRLDEPLGLAVGLGPVRPGPPVAGVDRLQGPLIRRARCTPRRCRSGRARSGPHARRTRPRRRAVPGMADEALSLGTSADVGQPGDVVDEDLDMVVAEPGLGRRLACQAEDPVAAADRDPAELLVVLVDERARVLPDVADRGRPTGGRRRAAGSSRSARGPHTRSMGRGPAADRSGAVPSAAPTRARRIASTVSGAGDPGQPMGSAVRSSRPHQPSADIAVTHLWAVCAADALRSAAFAIDQPSSSTRLTRSWRPNTLSRAVRCAMRASSRVVVLNNRNFGRGSRSSTTCLGITPRA